MDALPNNVVHSIASLVAKLRRFRSSGRIDVRAGCHRIPSGVSGVNPHAEPNILITGRVTRIRTGIGRPAVRRRRDVLVVFSIPLPVLAPVSCIGNRSTGAVVPGLKGTGKYRGDTVRIRQLLAGSAKIDRAGDPPVFHHPVDEPGPLPGSFPDLAYAAPAKEVRLKLVRSISSKWRNEHVDDKALALTGDLPFGVPIGVILLFWRREQRRRTCEEGAAANRDAPEPQLHFQCGVLSAPLNASTLLA